MPSWGPWCAAAVELSQGTPIVVGRQPASTRPRSFFASDRPIPQAVFFQGPGHALRADFILGHIDVKRNEYEALAYLVLEDYRDSSPRRIASVTASARVAAFSFSKATAR